MYKPEILSLYHYQSLELKSSSPSDFKERGILLADGIYLDKYKIEPLLSRQAFFSSLSNYNDPFEGEIDIETSPDDAEIICNLLKNSEVISRMNTKLMPDENIREELKATLSDYSPALSSGIQENLKSNIGFYCLTPINNDMLMWAHYADNHNGIALEFDRTPDSVCGSLTFEVDYFDEPPKVDLSSMLSDFYRYSPEMSNQERARVVFDSSLRKLLYSKKKVWVSENEWRTSNDVGLHPMPGKLKSIIFGLNCNLEIVKYLREQPELNDVEFKFIKKCPKTYSFQIIDSINSDLIYHLYNNV
ncbi:hypothetical protein M634_09515 [Vibrio parahaemolyticus O1:Kuk str. FDA_R31]|uniref:DUF2971 domain-containing protein n=2 Tax=Vibrio parahaemolyticus TaxID=670 RepID=UPI0003591CEC|nr:DUF2971 domain-containing protein [Vibrio parahaemolyticus]AGQ92136.1 hypothetical protein M634_09515 [Vibrio parahaemolyticus O1:Kuk str. FDA_R31]EJG1206945.1 DUF2971 domain-containing protein [Vibrio parahaemolyticus]ODW58228.1 hypothetical protein BBL89_23365 [Vibrio parahaemolyticus]ODW63882.1 hypothetical protein BBL90_17525 [Vibrio parahaemolyticus]TOH23024.1 DUF2971 domain-containing protein [Vibrio parahaemolyticus]